MTNLNSVSASIDVGAAHAPASPRKPRVAALFSFLVPGLGQLYSGLPQRALIVSLLGISAEFLGIPLAMALTGRALLIAVALLIVFREIVIPWDAYRRARDARPRFLPRNYNRWYVYAPLILVYTLIIRPEIRRFTLAKVVRTYHTPSTAMRPTLLEGDFVFARIRHAPAHRGGLVAYRSAGETYLKRVVGMPGDTISMKRGTLSVNGLAIVEPYASPADSSTVSAEEFHWQRTYLLSGVDSVSYQPTLSTWGPLVVPARQYFVLGDNRSQSDDSRYEGFVDERAIIAEPTTVYFSRDPVSKNIRWRRIGLSIR
jgi:signal peptidase I